jgi:hypothetical protein
MKPLASTEKDETYNKHYGNGTVTLPSEYSTASRHTTDWCIDMLLKKTVRSNNDTKDGSAIL